MEVSWGERNWNLYEMELVGIRMYIVQLKRNCERSDVKERIASYQAKEDGAHSIEVAEEGSRQEHAGFGGLVAFEFQTVRSFTSALDDVTIRTSAVCLASAISRPDGSDYTLVVTYTFYLGRHSFCNIQSSKGHPPWTLLLMNLWPKDTTIAGLVLVNRPLAVQQPMSRYKSSYEAILPMELLLKTPLYLGGSPANTTSP